MSRHSHTSPMSEELDEAVSMLLTLFPELDPSTAIDHLELLMQTSSLSEALEMAIEDFLDPATVIVNRREFRTTEEASTSQVTQQNVDASASTSSPVSRGGGSDQQDVPDSAEVVGGEAMSDEYYEWCVYSFGLHFSRIAIPVLKNAISYHGELSPAYAAVDAIYQRLLTGKASSVEKEGYVRWWPRGKLRLLKHERAPRDPPTNPCMTFEHDWAALLGSLESTDLAEASGTRRTEREALMECGCCCDDVPFEKMVQCTDGHLFCSSCVRRSMEEFSFGGGGEKSRGALRCIDHESGCSESFPWSEVQRTLPSEFLMKYEQREAEDAVARARLQGLVYCPFCSHPWEVDPMLVVLECKCGKASCIKCKEPNHLPKRCDEIEKQSETSLRRQVEECMTKALIRECTACKAELVKMGGCNKVTCRCGQTMCYVCRTPISTSYKHFCQLSYYSFPIDSAGLKKTIQFEHGLWSLHAREPGKPCYLCSGCSLWEEENEDEIVHAAKVAAIKDVVQKEPTILKREIGPTEGEFNPKRPKIY